MKKLFFFICIISLAIVSCNDDDDNGPNGSYLRYDGPNVIAPTLNAGTHEFAARFTINETANFLGRTLTEIEWDNGPAPQSAEIRVYGEGTATTPGTLRYSANITNSFVWDGGQGATTNSHILAVPIVIEDTDIWISIRVVLSDTQQSVGCDAGPRKEGGDWLFSSEDNEWRTFIDRVPGESVNWNIRGVIADE